MISDRVLAVYHHSRLFLQGYRNPDVVERFNLPRLAARFGFGGAYSGANLKPLEEAAIPQSGTGITYVATAARAADALTQNVLLASIESSVIPLPNQIRSLSQAIYGDRIRYLLADEVGLGKTIEAGLVMRELKLRGMVACTLVIAPKGLVTQWVSEMRTHFNEDFPSQRQGIGSHGKE